MEEKQLLQKYNIDLEALKKEQIKLAKNLVVKDSVDFSLSTKFSAVENLTIKNKIISAVIVCDKEGKIIEQQYFLDTLRFPYIHGFRAYRELSAMVEAFNKLTEKPDLVFIRAHGISHKRLGLASHFSLAVGVPAIGITGELFDDNKLSEDGEYILLDKKKVGRTLKTKENANPIFISPGDKISIDTSYDMTKLLVKSPHKLPEPMHLAHKYAKEIQKELKL